MWFMGASQETPQYMERDAHCPKLETWRITQTDKLSFFRKRSVPELSALQNPHILSLNLPVGYQISIKFFVKLRYIYVYFFKYDMILMWFEGLKPVFLQEFFELCLCSESNILFFICFTISNNRFKCIPWLRYRAS